MISVLYNGGGTSNALQAAADLDAVIALSTQPTSIATGDNTGIELFLSGAADDKTPVVVCINHTASAITLTTIVHIQEDAVTIADMAFKVDRSVWGLTATTDHEPKRLVYFPCAPDSYVSIVCQSLDTTAFYARYRLTQMHTAASGGVGAAEGDAATAGKQDTGNTSAAAAAADLNELTAAPVAKVPASVVQVLAGTPAPIALPAGDATAIYLQSARANGVNTGNVFIGIEADLVSGKKNYITLTPGTTWEYICRAGTKVAMATFGIDGETATDGVIGYYEPV